MAKFKFKRQTKATSPEWRVQKQAHAHTPRNQRQCERRKCCGSINRWIKHKTEAKTKGCAIMWLDMAVCVCICVCYSKHVLQGYDMSVVKVKVACKHKHWTCETHAHTGAYASRQGVAARCGDLEQCDYIYICFLFFYMCVWLCVRFTGSYKNI